MLPLAWARPSRLPPRPSQPPSDHISLRGRNRNMGRHRRTPLSYFKALLVTVRSAGYQRPAEGPGPRQAPTTGGPTGPVSVVGLVEAAGRPGRTGAPMHTRTAAPHPYPHLHTPCNPATSNTTRARLTQAASSRRPLQRPFAKCHSKRTCVRCIARQELTRLAQHTNAAGDTLLCHIQMSQPFFSTGRPT
ncbi:hypothetical protein E2C01_059488 [Portunus trituberculatus]|uniref:Uncharacterized protein n=1 Tax=Portunus trituberculatus TaxID=210409 RepID=A0A5B7H974_PORTR|nr:hypothetical protein [Portunus trituberculatus]